MPQHITVVPYDPAWPRLFEEEAARLRAVLGDNAVAVYHIGSTAVEGLAAKPVIDILPVVKELARVDDQAEAFRTLGYEYMGKFGIPGRRYLRKGGDERTHHMHVFGQDSERDIRRHLAVRDYLRCHPETAREYGALKTALAQRFPWDNESYCDGKDAFVQALERDALAWYACQHT